MAIETEIPSYIIPPEATPESVKRRRAIAELMIRQGSDFSPVQHWSQGAARIANALVGSMIANRADKEEHAREAATTAALAGLPGLGGAPSMTPVRPMGMSSGAPSAMPAVSAEIPPEGQALLTAISGSESNYPGKDPYKVIYGGREATSFADHPRQYVPIVSGPNRGQKTSAAGRYQYLGRSWDEAKNALNLPDFSPESQDKAAWWDAQRTYKTNTGRDLAEDIKLAGNDPQKLSAIGRGISTWWTSLPGGIEPNKATGSFGNRFARALQPPALPLGPQVADTSGGYVPTAPMGPQSMAYAPEAVGASGMGATVPQSPMTAGPVQAAPQAPEQPTQVAQAYGQPVAAGGRQIDPELRAYIQRLFASGNKELRGYGLQLWQNAIKQEAPPTDVREYEYGLRNPDFARRQIELKQAGRPQTQVNVGGGSDKQVFDAMEKSAATAQTAANGLVSIGEARRAVEGGAILGAGADFRLGLQKVGAALGATDPQAIVNTETFRSAIAPQVAALMKATVGSTQISNADREFAEKAAGGSITLDEGTIRRLLGIMERAGKAAVSQHRRRLDKVYPATGQFERERALFDVEDIQPPQAPEPPARAQSGGSGTGSAPDGTIIQDRTGTSLIKRGGQWVPFQ